MPGLMLLMRAELHRDEVDVAAVGALWARLRRLVWPLAGPFALSADAGKAR